MARPRQEDAIDIARLAVEKAIEMMRQRGSPDFSLSELAREIGCSAPALYNHFADKDDLVAHIRAEAFARATAEKKARYEGPIDDPVQRLRDGGRAYLDFARENPALFRLVYGASSGGTLGETIPAEALRALSAGVRACGIRPEEDAERVAFMMWSAAHGAALLALNGLAPGTPDERWASAYATVDTLVALICPPGPVGGSPG